MGPTAAAPGTKKAWSRPARKAAAAAASANTPSAAAAAAANAATSWNGALGSAPDVKPSAGATVKGLIEDYIANLPLAYRDRIYQQPATCLALFRFATPLGKQIIMRILYAAHPIPLADMKLWCTTDGEKELIRALEHLYRLHIIAIPDAPPPRPAASDGVAGLATPARADGDDANRMDVDSTPKPPRPASLFGAAAAAPTTTTPAATAPPTSGYTGRRSRFAKPPIPAWLAALQSGPGVALSPHFRQSLHNALTGSGDHASFGQESTAPDKHLVTQAMLDQYATERWEAVLHYLVGSPSGKRKRAVTKLLEHSGLMARVVPAPGEESLQQGDGSAASSTLDRDYVAGTEDSDEANLTITSKGFQFLLQDVNVQVWAFLLQYLQMSDELKMDLVEVLGFLFQLGSLRFGASYSVDTLTETQKHMLEDLKPLGIVYQRKKKSSRFYPTRLATTLTSKTLLSSGADGDSATGHAAGGQSLTGEETGFIIVETNYRVYAYTSSALEIAVLSLFVNLKARFMNMVVGMITRDSVREALSKGISATQIIDYLTSQAHPELKKNNPVLPATVSDQIRLWEMEKERITPSHAWLYRDFARQDDYEATVAYAEAYNFVLWKNPTNRIIVVDARGQDQVRAYLKRAATAHTRAVPAGAPAGSQPSQSASQPPPSQELPVHVV